MKCATLVISLCLFAATALAQPDSAPAPVVNESSSEDSLFPQPEGSALISEYEFFENRLPVPEGLSLFDKLLSGLSFARSELGSDVRAPGVSFGTPRGLPIDEDISLDEDGAEELPNWLVEEGGAEQSAGAETATVPTTTMVLIPLLCNGIPLSKGSDVLSVTDASGRLLSRRERQVPKDCDAAEPTTSHGDALALARADLAGVTGQPMIVAAEPQLEMLVDAQMQTKLTWTMAFKSEAAESLVSVRYWVAARGAAHILKRESETSLSHAGFVSAPIWMNSPLTTPQSKEVSAGTVVRQGAGGGTAQTDSQGRFTFRTGTGNATLNATLNGGFAVVHNKAGANISVSQVAPANVITKLAFAAASEQDLAQTTAYGWVDYAHRFALANHLVTKKQLLRTVVNVNLPKNCNAYFWGADVSLNFRAAGGGCVNTAYPDIVVHEFGHAIDFVNGGKIDSGYGEGFGDALWVLMSYQPCVGRDFTGSGSCVRDARAVVTWPQAKNTDPHVVGQIYSGFVWQLVQELKKKYTSKSAYDVARWLVFRAAVANPKNIPDAVRLSFVADDDDGNPKTCSRYFAELAAAAKSRKIPHQMSCTPKG